MKPKSLNPKCANPKTPHPTSYKLKKNYFLFYINLKKKRRKILETHMTRYVSVAHINLHHLYSNIFFSFFFVFKPFIYDL